MDTSPTHVIKLPFWKLLEGHVAVATSYKDILILLFLSQKKNNFYFLGRIPNVNVKLCISKSRLLFTKSKWILKNFYKAWVRISKLKCFHFICSQTRDIYYVYASFLPGYIQLELIQLA